MDYSFSCSAKAISSICFCVFVLIGTASSRDTICPFDFLFHLGDGAFDIGNAIRRLPCGPTLPAAKLPYGVTSHTTSEGRWSDGYLDLDYGASAMGFKHLRPSLAKDASSSNGVIFAVARSPVLDREFFGDQVKIPQFAAPLSIQISWFKQYLKSVCTTPEDCADVLGNSLFIMGDVEANDIAFPLIQGVSAEEVRTYAPHVTEAQISVAREVIQMGARRVIFTGNVPLGCYPYILTELATSDPKAYDDLGCLKGVNELVMDKNKDLQDGVENLKKEFPDIFIYFADFYDVVYSLLKKAQSKDVCGSRDFLKACCGTGGIYNYNSSRFCGAGGVPVCSDPSKYIFWDGIHLTDETNYQISVNIRDRPLKGLNCTSQSWSKSLKPKKNVINVSPCGDCGFGWRNDYDNSITETWFSIKSTTVVAFVAALLGIAVYYKRAI